jgi:hypothetical protein
MANGLKSSSFGNMDPERKADGRGAVPPGWLKVGAVAVASAVFGGLAAAWFYSKTLSRLREAEDKISNSESGITGDELGEDF